MMAEEEKEAQEEVQEANDQVEESGSEEAVKPKKTGRKHKKVTSMNLAEIEAALAGAQEKMGGYNSNYAQFLLARREYLLGSGEESQKKAA